MARNGSGIYSLPSGSTVSNGTTADASDINTPFADIAADLNVARPIVAGGTGATSASAARTNLGVGTAALTTFAPVTGNAATDVQAAIAVNTAAREDRTADVKTLLASADNTEARSNLGLGGLAVVDILDEDNMATDSATRPPSQQSTVAYVAAEIATAVTSREFTSSGVSFPTGAGDTTFAHGLASSPKELVAWIVCQTAELGYAINDVVPLSPNMDGDGGRNYTLSADATNITFTRDGGGFVLTSLADVNRSTATLTPANWQLFVRGRT